jgi:hypothetical protein
MLQLYLFFERIEFGEVWRHFLSLIRDPISGRDGLTRSLRDNAPENLSGAVSWLTFYTLKTRCRTPKSH